ncbi:PREDICTED: prospero homeobox protein 1-like [Cyprinodon variegatus]|uniref:Prospero homeobox 3 n=1 Tax=Cyprinodon variegatus TaxID=28743 RepID=A0A3Q2GLG7_CYPVA|nr:PREDICTED: prospero homeobox protein 1-like [Cyprinodon variegatus]XP_015229289.1 PREDICTED: prospero homeobox protein 1-like [Cyprinodon variegatus]
MDSPSDLFDDSSPQLSNYTPGLSSADLPGVHIAPAFRPPGFPLIHHLLQPGGGPRRIGGILTANLSMQRQVEGRSLEEEVTVGQIDGRMEGAGEGMTEAEDDLTEVKRKCSDTVLMAEWSQDVMKVKRMKLECRQKDKVVEEGGKKREGRRREKEELKEQLEEARERLQALQEKVWKAFGEKTEKEEKKRKRNRCEVDGEGDEGMVEDEEDVSGEMYDEEDFDTTEIEKDSFSLLSVSHFDYFQKRKEHLQKDRGTRTERVREGDMEGIMEGSRLWVECGGLTRSDWDGGTEDEDEEEGKKFAQALKLELGSAVARVIDRVLRLYTEMTDNSSPPAAISFQPSDQGHDTAKEGEDWMRLLTRERVEEPMKEKEDADREQQLKKLKNGGGLPPGPPRCSEQSDLPMPLAVHRSPDTRKTFPLLAPPLSTNINSSHPNLPLHHPSLTRPTPLAHPPLLPPPSQSKETSSASFHPSSSSSSSSSSFPAPPPPPPPPPLPLPLLHYSMQQLFSRSLHHPQLPHLAPSRKDYLGSDPFLEFSSHASFPPLPFLGHLDPSLTRHGVRERERGVRGDGSIRGGGGMDGGELYLTAGGTQEGLSPCHLKKAKLMFFYTRYPSSNTLKTYFPEVKFNRCVTSQMIKWFSNFREFFYIQMERFARQAVRDTLTRDGAARLGRESQLRVSRDTELYRILNMHYNKSNVYQVPERFIEVSEVALREFYSAIWTGRDSDPCWKKGIYKIICKLDSPLPDAFRMPGFPVG